MCFGVRDAVALALNSPRRTDLTVLGELVHNPEVLRRLREAGVRSATSLDSPVLTQNVMITAHGASHRAVERLHRRGLHVEDATCPLVRHAHRSLHRLVAAGYFPVVIGRRGHVEVEGLVGDLDEYEILETPGEVFRLAGRSPIGVVSQTTQPLEHVLRLVALIRQTFPHAEVRFSDTVCQPTKERQESARRLAASCDVVIVVGGRKSNNSRQLVDTCLAGGARAYQVENAGEVRAEWLEGALRVGLTAGTSTPDQTIAEVHRALLRLASTELAMAA
jgi:4-hydroxy-3-methylbut-2-enyl diphosphate reductase